MGSFNLSPSDAVSLTRPIVPLCQYQKDWLQDSARFKIGMMSRQVGKTFTTTLEISLDSVSKDVHDQRGKWVILSRGERQSKAAMEEVYKHLQVANAVARHNESEWKGDDGTYKQLEAILPNGTRIIALPANPDTARGYTADVYLDEFAIHQDSRKIWTALFPVISAGRKLRITSTPKGKGNKFYDLMTTNDPIWSKHTVDIYRAVREGLPRDVDELRRALDDEDAWAQEFECKWLDDAESYLSFDLIMSAEHPDAGDPSLYQGGPCYLGNDIAARRDLWVLWIKELVGDVLVTREIKTLRRAKFAEHDAALDAAMRRYDVQQLVMDQTGMGEKPVEDAVRRYGSSRVRGVIFNPQSKFMMAQCFKQSFEDRRERIPEGDTALRYDLHKIKKTVGAEGLIKLHADSDAQGHADRFWAGAMATFAASQGIVVYDHHSVRPASAVPRRFDHPDHSSDRRALSAKRGSFRLAGTP